MEQQSKRLFVAFPATDPLAEIFLPTLKKLKTTADRDGIDVKWVPPKNYHLTVAFLGDTPVAEIEELHKPIQACADKLTAFQLNVSGLNAFPDEFHARTLWIGAQQKMSLPGIAADLTAALGLTPEDREYTPHITIGKIRKTKSCKNLLSPFVRKDFGKIRVDRFILFESIQQNYTSVYVPLREYMFGANQNDMHP